MSLSVFQQPNKWPNFLGAGVVLCVLFLINSMNVAYAAPSTEPGTVIANTASASWQQSGETRTADSNTVETTSEIVQTSAEIQFLRLSNSAGQNSQPADIQNSQCGDGNGNFTAAAPATKRNGDPVTAADNLAPAVAYVQGEPIYFEVADADQNLDPASRESVLVTLLTQAGDREQLTIFETGNDSGVFAGYIQSVSGPITQYDCQLSVDRNTQVTIEYVDRFDSTEERAASALVDPYGIVFDSTSGQPVDGVEVTLINASTGQAAQVFADDGVTPWPSTVITGDAALGFNAGQYRFPLVNEGEYLLRLVPVASYAFPSSVPSNQLPQAPNGDDYVVIQGSYGENFLVPQGPAVRIDLPIDPSVQDLILEKSAQRSVVQQGDFLRYTLNVTNNSGSLAAVNTVITDQLPMGLRYQAGSTLFDGVRAIDPTISPDGRTLSFEVGDLPLNASREVNYVARISANAVVGPAVNRATAVANGGLFSNLAEVSVTVEAAFKQGTMTLVGRVMETDCSDEDRPARPVVGVRIYLENGRFAITDDDGKYHFEGVSARPHVVQLDQGTLPAKYEPQFCYDDTRYAGTPFSRFVDNQEASLWRADFYVREKPDVVDSVDVRLQSKLSSDSEVTYRLQFQANEIGVSNSKVSFMLPKGVEPIMDSARVDGTPVRIRSRQGVVTVPLSQDGAEFVSEVELTAEVQPGACNAGVMTTTALGTFGTEQRKRNRTAMVKNSLACVEQIGEPETYVYRPTFKVLSTVLEADDLVALRELAGRLVNRPIAAITVRGHTDSDMIPQRNKHLFADNNVLGAARARAVAYQLANWLKVDLERIEIEGVGPWEPMASNDTAEGKAANRRVEVMVYTSAVNEGLSVELLDSDSGFKSVNVTAQGWKEREMWQPTLTMQPALSVYDSAWASGQSAEFSLELPSEGYNPAGASIPIAVKHASNQRVQVVLNGEMVSALNYVGRELSRNRKVAVSSWNGVDIPTGDNELVVKLLDKKGAVLETITRKVRRSTAPVNAVLVADRSLLQIDGEQPPVVAIRLTDVAGAPASRGATGEVALLTNQLGLEEAVDQVASGSVNGRKAKLRYVVEDDSGLAFIRLSPATLPGKVELQIGSDQKKIKPVTAYLTEKPRDWILVGLAEGSLSQNVPPGSVKAANGNEVYSDGRVALFAKGRIRGDALLTMRYDSSKTENSRNGLHGDIDPNAWYTLYGDQSLSGREGASQEKLFVRLERDTFYAMYGDIETDFSVVELANYHRSLTGLKSELRGQYVSYDLFAAETETGFARDEIRGDGTSGLYRLGQVPVANSEKIIIETRHRLRSQEIVETRLMRRFYDYQINYSDGTIFFREPVAVTDDQFNPVYIVAEYETDTGGKKQLSAGARVEVHNVSQRLAAGLTYIIEDEDLANRSLIAADGRIRFGKFSELKVEYGETRRDLGGINTVAAGKVIEVSRRGSRLNGSVYFRELEAGYGLGGVNASENATRKIGAEGQYKINDTVSLKADIANEKNLTQGNTRDYAEAGLRITRPTGHVEVGVRHAEDTDAGGVTQQSQQAIVDARKSFFKNFIGLSARYEAALSEKNAAADFPDRVVLGLDVRVAKQTQLFVTQEFTKGAERDTRSTKVGVQSGLWKGASMQSYIAQDDSASGQRLYSGNNITQQIAFGDGWWASMGYDQADTLKDTGATSLNPDTPLANGSDGDDFRAGHLSFGRKGDLWHWDLRLEGHRSDSKERDGVISSWRRQSREGKGVDLALRWLSDKGVGTENTLVEAQFGLVWRPIEAKWFFLNRLDLIHENQRATGSSDFRSSRVVNQFNANYVPNFSNQLSLFLGTKYVEDTIDDASYSGWYSQLGVEYRHSINEWWDLGVQVASHNDWVANNQRYSAGLNVGVSPLQNLWITLGYNWAGFRDDDFDAAAWTQDGAYLRFRLKFDQQGNGVVPRTNPGMPAEAEY